MSVWKSVGQSLAGLAGHAAKRVIAEPVEVVKDMVGQNLEKGNQTQQQSAGDDTTRTDPLQDLAKAGFKTKDDFQKYQGLSGEKDRMELEQVRGKLVREWGLDANLESGMQKARMEWEQKEEQRKKVEEKKEEEKKEFEFEKAKQEDLGLKAATESSSPENQAWGAG